MSASSGSGLPPRADLPDSRSNGSSGGNADRVKALAQQHPRWSIAIAIVLALILGYAAHPSDVSASDSLQSQLDSAQAQVAALTTQLSTLRAQLDGAGGTNDQLTAQIANLQEQLRQAKATQPLPGFLGSQLSDVQAVAADIGWNLSVKEKESSKPVGTVLSQSPKQGTLMHFGALFTITVAKPLPPKAPNLVGKKQKDAQAVADKYGWKLVVQKEESYEPVGTILSQTPAPGTVMRGSAKLTIVIAKKVTPAPPVGGGGGGGGGSSNCHPSYTGACLLPNASDYDCAGGSGNGPYYVEGPVYVVGPDVFGLDADGDGVGCE